MTGFHYVTEGVEIHAFSGTADTPDARLPPGVDPVDWLQWARRTWFSDLFDAVDALRAPRHGWHPPLWLRTL